MMTDTITAAGPCWQPCFSSFGCSSDIVDTDSSKASGCSDTARVTASGGSVPSTFILAVSDHGLTTALYSTKLISCLWAILCLVANLLYLTDAKNVFVDHGSETASGIWRAVLPMFVVLHLATVCAGQLQSYAVGHTSTSRPVLRARTCNIIFVTALATATLGLLVSGHARLNTLALFPVDMQHTQIIAIIGSVSGAKMWQSWITVRNTAQPIVDPSAGFPPDFNPLTIEATLRRQFATFGMWATMYNR